MKEIIMSWLMLWTASAFERQYIKNEYDDKGPPNLHARDLEKKRFSKNTKS